MSRSEHVSLHPQARAALAETADLPDRFVPGRDSFDLAATRARNRRQSGRGEPVRRVVEVSADDVPCRLFLPQPVAPMMLYLHGGGWALGSVEEAEPLCRAIANESGWAVMAVEYRLAPEHPYPAALEDVERAVAWLERHDGALGLDSSRLALAGDSAGANLAAAVTLRARDRGACAFGLQGFCAPRSTCSTRTPCARSSWKGLASAARRSAGTSSATRPPSVIGSWRMSRPCAPRTSGGLPPALIVTAEYDPLSAQGEDHAWRLAAAGVPVVATRYLGMVHEFLDLERFDAALAVVSQVASALRHMAI